MVHKEITNLNKDLVEQKEYVKKQNQAIYLNLENIMN